MIFICSLLAQIIINVLDYSLTHPMLIVQDLQFGRMKFFNSDSDTGVEEL